MRNKQRNRYLVAGVSRSRIVIALLVFIALLVLSLVGRALQNAHNNRMTATVVLQDYARLVADEYVRRAMGEVGYYGYFAYVNALRQQIVEGKGIQEEPADVAADETGSLARYRFVIDLNDPYGDWSLPVDERTRNYLWSSANSILATPQPESGLTIDHVPTATGFRTVVFATLAEPDRVFGFEVDQAALTARLAKVFEENQLLPPSLAKGAITNEHIYLRLSAPQDRVLFQSKDEYDPYLVVHKMIGDDYSGIFEGHQIETAIGPDIGYKLIIGSLPGSRLPGLIIITLLTFGLLFAAIRQLNREQALLKMRTDFVSEVSHELRTPLTQIRMFTETLLFDRFETGEDKKRALEIINRESQRLAHLVENVLQFSNDNGEKRELSPVHAELAPVIEKVVAEFRPLAESADNCIELDLDKQAAALFDADALRQILLNLLDNAVKYGPAGQTIRVSLRDASDAVELGVCDEGPGIPAAERERIWGGYYRLERERQSAIAGTGIGLAVVRDLVTRLCGSVRIDSADDTGACFVVTLPKTRPE
jgi:signal transduction histidine kinase